MRSNDLTLVTESVEAVTYPDEIVRLTVKCHRYGDFKKNIVARTVLALVTLPTEPIPKPFLGHITSPAKSNVAFVD